MSRSVAGMPVGSLAGFLNVGFQGFHGLRILVVNFGRGLAHSGN